MTTDFKQLCAELTEELDDLHCHYDVPSQSALLKRARAALAESAPSAERKRSPINIDEMCEILRSLEIKATEYTDCTILYEVTFDQLRAICDTRAALADEPPAKGEVAELVAWIRGMYWAHPDKKRATRAADLLQRRVLVPVAVSERLPGPKDCDADGRCWFGTPKSDVMEAYWVFRKWAHRRSWDAHWLPAHALPVPGQEVEQ